MKTLKDPGSTCTTCSLSSPAQSNRLQRSINYRSCAVMLSIAFALSACGGGGGGGGTTTPQASNNWDQMVWDQGNWQ